nr:hypothetical protein [Tanacetum cinerariifolium]
MSTQQDIYAAGSESRPPMLNKENYVTWSSRPLRYAKSRPNGKLIHDSIINGPYVRRMIPEPGDTNREVPVNETFHVQTNDELTEKELKQIEIWLRVQQMMKGSDIGILEKKAKLFNEWERFTSNEGESIESYYYRFLKLMNDSKRNKHFPKKIASNLKFLNNLQPEWSRHVTIVHQTKDLHTADYTQLYDFLKYNQKEKYMQQPMPNPEDITDPTTTMNMALTLMAKAFNLNYSTPTNNNQRISSNPRNRQIAQRGMNMGQDRQMQMVGGNANQNLNGNGNLVAARAEGNANGHNGNQIRCYNCRGVGHFARNCTTRPKRRDAAYLQTQLLIAQKEEAGIQLQAEEYDIMAAVADLDVIEEVNANYILMANLHQASTSGTQSDKALVYDSDGSAENDFGTHNWSSSAHQELHKIVKDENFLIVNQVDARVQNFEIQFLKEAAKFIGDFKSLAKEADESIAKHKALELEIERLLRAVVSQDIMSVVQKTSVVDTSNLQTELERTKERFENCIIKKENEYAKLWNDWYKKCDECKSDKISYDKAYKDMQQKIERLQAQLGDLKGKSKDTSCVSDTLNPLSHKLENENVELEFQKDIKRGMSANTKSAKQSIVKNLPKIDEIHALSKPVTSNLVLTPQESKVVKNDKVIAPGMFRINPFKTSREEKHVPNNVRASSKTKPITISQHPVITKKDVNSDSNGLSSTRINNTTTRRPQPRSNTKNDRAPSVSKSSRSKNKGAEVEEHRRNLLLSKNTKHMSSACNNIKLDSQNVISKVVCAMCKQCLISVNHDVCLRNYVNGKNSRGKNQKGKCFNQRKTKETSAKG